MTSKNDQRVQHFGNRYPNVLEYIRQLCQEERLQNNRKSEYIPYIRTNGRRVTGYMTFSAILNDMWKQDPKAYLETSTYHNINGIVDQQECIAKCLNLIFERLNNDEDYY